MTDTLEHDIEQALKAMVARDAIAVPPYPAVALKLSELIRSDSYGLPDIVRLVASDARLTADLLRCANSTVYARGKEVTSLQQAVTAMGAQEVMRLTVASALSATTSAPGPLQALKRDAWQCGVTSAVLCQELASLRGVARDDAFLCGLLHDFGRLLALSGLEEILAEMPEIAAIPVESWVALVDRVHVELGLRMATHWKLATVFQDVIAHHHDADPAASGPHAALVDIVATSDAIVGLLMGRPSVGADDLKSVPRLGDAERERLAAVVPGIPGVIASFEADTRGRAAPSKVAVPETTLPEGFRKLQLPVQAVKPKKRGPYTLQGIASTGWVMTGKEAIPQNSLIEVVVEAKPKPITLWAHATLCAPQGDGDGVRIECKAFALSGPAAGQWGDLFRTTPR